MSLATKYRPKTLDEMIGQENIVKILKQQLLTNNIKNCYLFCGTSGCGKTTAGKAFANLINKNKGYPIEFDAASNSSVEDVRNIISSSNTRSILGEYKIFIIDECHSLSNTAWQAFLKTLEEPNAKTIFIFCTTDPQKIPQTILNRVQRFDFGKIPNYQIFQRLEYVCKEEHFTYTEDALNYIIKLSQGRMRDALTYLEKVVSLGTDITLDKAFQALGEINYQAMFDLTNCLVDRDKGKVLTIINNLNSKGKDLKLFINEYTSFILDVNKYIILKDFTYIDIPKLFEKDLLWILNFDDSTSFYLNVLESLIKLKEQIRFESDIKVNLEIILLTLCK